MGEQTAVSMERTACHGQQRCALLALPHRGLRPEAQHARWQAVGLQTRLTPSPRQLPVPPVDIGAVGRPEPLVLAFALPPDSAVGAVDRPEPLVLALALPARPLLECAADAVASTAAGAAATAGCAAGAGTRRGSQCICAARGSSSAAGQSVSMPMWMPAKLPAESTTRGVLAV